MKVSLTFLGTGTSQGVPIIGCRCPVCQSADRRDKRYRSAALVNYGGLTILIDAGPDFRMQMIREGVRHLDAILLTHNHKDHTGGLDDVRSLNYIDRTPAEIYCEQPVLDTLRREYGYAFAEVKYPGAPEWRIHLIDDQPFMVQENAPAGPLEWIHDVGYRIMAPDGSLIPTGGGQAVPAEKADDPLLKGNAVFTDGRKGIEVIPIRGFHGQMPVLGFRFGDIAYITDMSRIPEEEMLKLKGLKHLSLNTVGYKQHHSHFSLDEALLLAEKIGAEHCWLTHLSHTFPVHERFCEELRQRCTELGVNADVQPAYDGLVVEA